jgi:protein-S-isoprenylcysteine O-methyltransferase Ste14
MSYQVMRLLSGGWFLLLAGFTLVAASQSETPVQLIARACVVMLYLMNGLLILLRPEPKSAARGLLPRAMAFVGSYMPWMISFLPKTDFMLATMLSPIFVISGIALALVSLLHLRTAFSLVPQARSVVSSGPYRWLRHPLYVSEEIAVIGVLLQHLSPIAVLIVIVHIAAQIGRIRYEEELLSRTFPSYLLRSARWRVFPLAW